MSCVRTTGQVAAAARVDGHKAQSATTRRRALLIAPAVRLPRRNGGAWFACVAGRGGLKAGASNDDAGRRSREGVAASVVHDETTGVAARDRPLLHRRGRAPRRRPFRPRPRRSPRVPRSLQREVAPVPAAVPALPADGGDLRFDAVLLLAGHRRTRPRRGALPARAVVVRDLG